MKTALVTGAGGFLGSHFVDELSQDSDYQIRKFVGDIKDKGDVVRNLRGCDTVVHFAALTYLPPSWDTPEAYFRVNTEGTLNFLKNSSMFRRFIYISTSHVYGNQPRTPIEITDTPLPNDPYSVSKRAAELLVRIYSERDGFDSLIIRPFNNFGPRQSSHFVVPTMCLQAIQKKKITLQSNTRREFIYCKDTARIVHLLLQAGATGLVQIARGASYQIYDIAALIATYTQVDAIDVANAPRPNDIECLEGSRKSLDYWLRDFEFTPVGQAVGETVDWYRILLKIQDSVV